MARGKHLVMVRGEVSLEILLSHILVIALWHLERDLVMVLGVKTVSWI